MADTNNKVGRTKIDPRGKIRFIIGYSTQHAGDVYRLLNVGSTQVPFLLCTLEIPQKFAAKVLALNLLLSLLLSLFLKV